MYKIDNRTAADIEKQIARTAKSYVPEWRFETRDPDMGSTIGRIYARQMEENVRAVNHVLEVYRAEFVNLLDLTLKRAVPSGTVVVFNLVDSGIPGTEVPKGTRVVTDSSYGDGDDGTAPVFETDRSLYVTASKLTDIFQTDREVGCIVPIMGKFDRAKLFAEEGEYTPGEEESPEDEEEILIEEENYDEMKPFILFGETEGIGRHALLLLHPTVFDVDGDVISVRFEGGEEIIRMISAGELTWSWLGKKGMYPFDDVILAEDGRTVKLLKHGENRKTAVAGDKEMNLLVLESVKPLVEPVMMDDVFISSSGGPGPIEFAGDGNGDFTADEFAPFTDTLSLFSECFIGKTGYFDKPGAKVTLRFHLRFLEHPLDVPREVAQSELKIIKRKEKAVREEAVTQAYADEITIEYFNGIGWKKLVCDTEYRGLFAEEKPGDYTLSFISPLDWAETESGAFHGHVLRLRLTNSNNCYMRPAIHHYPVLSGMTVEYTYENSRLHPAALYSIAGTDMTDLFAKSRKDEPLAAYSPIKYAEDALYLGFDEPIETGPVGMLFRLGNSAGQSGIKCRFEYSTRRGFKRMRVVDGTAGFSRSGIIQFMPPSDFYPMTLEGKRRYWVRVSRAKAERLEEKVSVLPHIEDIKINAMTVSNVVTGNEEEFYIDDAFPNMSFYLGATNILDADVWINERDSLSGEEMRALLTAHTDDVKVEYDIVGNISACYVRWHEIESFEELLDKAGADEWNARRCYRIDRLTGEIIFGDGITSDIPKVTDDVSFRISLRTCAGSRGNVAANSLTMLERDFMFIDTLYNPMRAYGGSNMETVRQALDRGADRVHSRGRMVSLGDYKRAILRFSGVIDKVGGITGQTIEGVSDPAELSFVLLMKDYNDGSFSFHRIEAELKKYLLSACEMTVAPHRLHIVEPIFVRISVSIWTEVMNVDDSFEVQNQIRETLDRYLDPVTGGADSNSGWEIGIMPKRSQILMQLAVLKNQALIRKTSITAAYDDVDGHHEVNYDDLKASPFMICTSGEHHVHILYDRGDNYAEN